MKSRKCDQEHSFRVLPWFGTQFGVQEWRPKSFSTATGLHDQSSATNNTHHIITTNLLKHIFTKKRRNLTNI